MTHAKSDKKYKYLFSNENATIFIFLHDRIILVDVKFIRILLQAYSLPKILRENERPKHLFVYTPKL